MTAQNEPQLSAELKIDIRRLREIIDEFVPGLSCPGCGGGVSFETGECEKCGGEMEAPNGEANYIVNTLEAFLATALEEQRASFVDEVKNRKMTIKWLWGKQKTDDECFLMVMEQVQRIAEFSKLNQLKGNHE